METTEITFIVSKKTKSAFELALCFSDKDKKDDPSFPEHEKDRVRRDSVLVSYSS
jgi:hypothetical protein